ncbi:MAG: hypothetical protein WA639_15710 [Candidatus Acidiferrum sp.]
MTTKHLSKSLAQASRPAGIVVLLSVFACSAHAQKYDREFEIGGQRLHESLKLFRARFPGAVCGSPLDDDHINRHTLDDPDSSGWLTCCIDQPKEVSAFSKFQVLSVNSNCPVLVNFFREHLQSAKFAVDAGSVENLLPQFVKLYGPVQHNAIIPTRTVPVRFASWMPYGSTLELSEEIVNGHDLRINPPIKDASPTAKIVWCNMFELGWSD